MSAVDDLRHLPSHTENDSNNLGRRSAKTHIKSSSWPHNRIPQDTYGLRNAVPQRQARHERTFSDSYRPLSPAPIIPRPHSSPRASAHLLSAAIPNGGAMRSRHEKSLLHDLLPPTPDVAKEREKWIYQRQRAHRQVSFNDTVVIISDGTGAETQKILLQQQDMVTQTTTRRPQSPPPKHIPFRAPTIAPSSVAAYDDSQLAMDLAEDLPAETGFFSKVFTKVGKRFM
ncbi:hypothetical protein K450DRAFT_256755 [Umbelopsis ramanniana AG]|uniref:Uncharacterized protein n=1 Tax=Umbelopsis ramanniana AG TaxID=1314678 RepID=A0AAD5HBE5_UMBRA|nr:uncharacterized protein K450DRAFT_256755 [Umbelopsis ramanniana AG]KAI8576436.1 hypothetical protein K450DRAFT_256755 [Umbelopsis ramanniana AG]